MSIAPKKSLCQIGLMHRTGGIKYIFVSLYLLVDENVMGQDRKLDNMTFFCDQSKKLAEIKDIASLHSSSHVLSLGYLNGLERQIIMKSRNPEVLKVQSEVYL